VANMVVLDAIRRSAARGSWVAIAKATPARRRRA